MKLVNLAPAVENFAAADSSAVHVEGSRCLHQWNYENTCQICTDACPTQAIALAPGGVTLDDAACVRCGYCLHACPTGVFTGVDETVLLLQSVNALDRCAALDLTCGHFPAMQAGRSVDGIIQVSNCMAALGAAAYVGLAVLGVERIGMRLEACASCPIGALRNQIEHTLARAGALTTMSVTAVNTPPAECVRKPVHATRAPQYSRRSLLRRFWAGEPASTTPLAALDSTPPEYKSPPLARRSLLQVLAHLPENRRATAPFFPLLTADASCTACQVCGNVCPTGAISFVVNDDAFALHFAPLACTECALCVELCAPGALQPAEPVAYGHSAPRILLAGQLKQCPRCRAAFAGAGALCPACAFRRRHPAGSRLCPASESAPPVPKSDSMS